MFFVLSAAILCAMAGEVVAQRRSWNWYFGDRAGITFRNGVVEPLTDGVLQTDEGCATFSNPANGQLWCYTDGVTVWNRNHEPMPNGRGLNGDASTSQSALIVQMPGTTNRLVIITPAPITSSDPGSRCLCLMYSIVDMQADGGLGDVVEKNVVLISDVTEHVTATATCDESGWWIIARRSSLSEFVSFRLTATGFDPVPTISPAGTLPAIRDVGQMHTSPDGRRLVITAPSGEAHLYRILRTTGRLYDGISLFAGEGVGTTYGAAFTTNSAYVVVGATESGLRNGTALYRFRIDRDAASAIRASRENIGFVPGVPKYAALQLASDGNIYVAKPDQQHLARVTAAQSPTPVVEDNAVTLSGTCRTGLPNIVGWLFGSHPPGDQTCALPDALVGDTTICVGSCVTPLSRSVGAITGWEWSIPGAVPATSADRAPQFCFPDPGRFVGTLIVENASGRDTTTFTILVRTGPNIDVPSEVEICDGDTIGITANGAATYQWKPSIGVSDPTSQSPLFFPRTETVYTLIGTDALGCVDSTTVRIKVVRLTAGPDRVICPRDTVQLTADSADTYLWQPLDGLSDPTVRSPFAFPSASTTYTVQMTRGGCTVVDTVQVEVSSALAVEIQAPAQACEGARVEVRVPDAFDTYRWSGDGVEPSDSSRTWVVVQANGRIVVEVSSGNCTAMDTAVIAIGGGPTVTASSDTTVCAGERVELTAQASEGTVIWTTRAGVVIGSGPTATVQPTITTTYVATVSTSPSCVGVDTVVVVVRDGPVISAGPDLGVCRGDAILIQAQGIADSYLWQPTDGLSSATVMAPVAQPDRTTTYIVMAERNNCIAYDTVVVEVSEGTVSVAGGTTICIGEETQLIASGSSRYEWSPADGLSDATIANPLASPLTTTTYRVVGSDRFGCVDTVFVTVSVLDTLGLTLRVGEVVAEAGATNVGIPVFVDVDAGSLPVRIDELRATLVFDASAFIPDSAERGLIVTSQRGTEQLVYLLMRDIPIVTTGQRITQIRGTVLLSSISTVPLRWEDVSWSGLTCPREETISGRLLITGCNIRNRAVQLFAPTTVQVVARSSDDVIEVTIEGGEPGEFQVAVVSVSGQVLTTEVIRRTLDQTPDQRTPHTVTLRMHDLASGLYYITTRTPSGAHIVPVVWMEE